MSRRSGRGVRTFILSLQLNRTAMDRGPRASDGAVLTTFREENANNVLAAVGLHGIRLPPFFCLPIFSLSYYALLISSQRIADMLLPLSALIFLSLS